MIIKVGDKVSVNVRNVLPREGEITDISIATHAEDPAGESGVQIQEYDTELDYAGSIGYVTENGDQYWAYFSQIEKDI
tara:strand:- start:297 stop:530 length:234 start_codon:yes stop_codon:yes gene_type:complete